MREIDLDFFVRANERNRFLQRGEHSETEEIDFDDLEVGAIVFVPLHDDAARHGGWLEWDDFIEPAFGHDHTAGMLPEVARQILNLHVKPDEMLPAKVGGIEADGG